MGYPNLSGVGPAQGQLITLDAQCNRIAQRRNPLYPDTFTGDKTHFQKASTAAPPNVQARDDAALAHPQFAQGTRRALID